MKEPTYKDILYKDSIKYIKSLVEEKKDNRQAMIELVQAHRLLERQAATAHLEVE